MKGDFILFKRILLFTITAILSLSISSCQKEGKPNGNSEDPPENIPVAVVNDTDIMLFDLFEMYQNLNKNYMEQGVNITDDDISNQILEEAINTLIAYELLYQNAIKEGYKVSQAKINNALEAVKSQYQSEEEFLNSLKMQQVTLDDFVEDLEREITVSDYVENTVEQPEVTEEEMLEMYEEYVTALEEDPEVEEEPAKYEDLKPRIEQKIKDDKFSEKVDALIETLRDESTVEIFREDMNQESL